MSVNEITKMEEGGSKSQTESGFCGSPEVVQTIQKVLHTYPYMIIYIYRSLFVLPTRLVQILNT